MDPEEAEDCRLTQSQSSQRLTDKSLDENASLSRAAATVAALPVGGGVIPKERIAFNRVHVLPSMGRGRIVGISKSVPHSDVKMFQSYR